MRMALFVVSCKILRTAAVEVATPEACTSSVSERSAASTDLFEVFDVFGSFLGRFLGSKRQLYQGWRCNRRYHNHRQHNPVNGIADCGHTYPDLGDHYSNFAARDHAD